MFKFTLKFFAWIFGSIFILLTAIYLFLWVVNFNDQQPSALSTKFTSYVQKQEKIPHQENAFIYMLGMSVAKDQDPQTQGEIRQALFNRVAAGETGDLEGSPVMQNYDYKSERSPQIKALSDLCVRIEKQKCLNAIANDEKSLTQWLEQEQWILDRYRKLISYTKYDELLLNDLTMPMPDYSSPMNTQKLFLIQLWKTSVAAKGNSTEIVRELNEDFIYWRMVSASAKSLISRMIAFAALKRNLAMGNFILKNLSALNGFSSIPEAWTKPFSKDELSLDKPLVGEWFYACAVAKNLKNNTVYEAGRGYVKKSLTDWVDILKIPMLQPQDSCNKHADFLANLLNKFDAPLNQYPDLIAKIEYEESQAKVHYSAYNSTGELLMRLAQPMYLIYVKRAADIEGVRQAAVLTSELRNQALSSDAIPDYIEKSNYHNPYTLKPFEWDSESKTIKFTGLEAGERGNYSFVY